MDYVHPWQLVALLTIFIKKIYEAKSLLARRVGGRAAFYNPFFFTSFIFLYSIYHIIVYINDKFSIFNFDFTSPQLSVQNKTYKTYK